MPGGSADALIIYKQFKKNFKNHMIKFNYVMENIKSLIFKIIQTH